MRIDEAHRLLSERAAAIANEKLFHDHRIPSQYSHIYQPLHDGLGVTFSEGFLYLSPAVLSAIQEIGREATKQAVQENPKILGNVIIEEARAGRNYFETFEHV